jgi:hypothetical protein
MAIGMATKKSTRTLETDQVEAIQKLVRGGKSDSVSGFVKHAVATSLADVAGWGALLGVALEESGRPLRPARARLSEQGDGSTVTLLERDEDARVERPPFHVVTLYHLDIHFIGFLLSNQVVRSKPGGVEDRRIEAAGEHDRHAFDLRLGHAGTLSPRPDGSPSEIAFRTAGLVPLATPARRRAAARHPASAPTPHLVAQRARSHGTPPTNPPESPASPLPGAAPPNPR